MIEMHQYVGMLKRFGWLDFCGYELPKRILQRALPEEEEESAGIGRQWSRESG
jgi:hypothetical protein